MSPYQFNAFSIPLLIAAALSMAIAIYAWTQRRAHSALALSLLALAIVEWCLGYALEIAATDLPGKILWGKAQYIGIALVPLFWLIFALRHTVRDKRPSWWVMILVSLLPAVTIVIAFTTESHGWLWKEIGLYENSYFSALNVSYGFWFWIHTAYSYIFLLIGAALLLRTLTQRQGMYRGQATALLLAVLAPWVGNAVYILGFSPIPHLDLTPFAFTVTIIGLAWAIFGYQLVNLSPMTRDMLVDNMADGMIVLDGRGRVADMNPAAGQMIGVPVSQAIGKPATDIFTPWPDMVERFRNLQEASDHLVVGEGEACRTYELRLSALRNRQGQPFGRMIMLRDVTEGIVPSPRYAPHTAEAIQSIANEPQPVPVRRPIHPLLGWLFNFLRAPVKANLPTPPNVNPKGYQTRERSFTLILRIIALIGTLVWFVTLSFSSFQTAIPFAAILATIWFLGLARQIHFNQRAAIFLVLMYALAFIETYSFGYSVESFVFFLGLNVIAALLLGRNGSLVTFTVTVITLIVFGVQIGRGAFVPPLTPAGMVMPASLPRAITALLTFWATASALIVSILVLIESLNRAWQLETQALNLLQQERDLLEVRIQERTRDLAEARDDALRSRDELRKYFLAIEQSGNTIVITDPQGNIEYANPNFFELTGYNSEETTGKNPRILQSGEHSREFYQDLWDTIRGGAIWHGEFHNRRKDGSLFWESATIAPVLNHLGETTHFVAIKEDITAQKEMQEQLRYQNEQMAREIAERMRAEVQNEAFLRDIKALQAVHLELSQAANLDDLYIQMITLSQQRLGLERVGLFMVDEATGDLYGTYGVDAEGQVRDEHTIRESITSDHWTWRIANAHHRVLVDEDALLYDKDRTVGRGMMAGTVLWNGHRSLGYLVSDNFMTHRSARPYEAELISLLGSTFGHLIEQKHAEARLQESEARFRQIVENASDIIYRISPTGHFTYVNPIGQRIIGYPEGELLGRHYLELTTPEYRHKMDRFYKRQVLGKIPTTYQEFPAITADGHEIWLGQNVQCIMEGDRIIELQALARDITERKRFEDALSLARDQALDASQVKGQLLSKVNHELRTPLGGILGYAELLRTGVFGPLSPEQDQALGEIMDSVNYLTAIVNELLDAAQIEARKMTLNLEPCSPYTILRQVEMQLAVLAQKKGLAFSTQAAPDLPASILGDERRLKQIAINLVGNAIKFTPAGEVRLKMFCPDAHHWAIQVSDTGIGIPPEAQGQIFEPFRQLHTSSTREHRGTGLGLSITRQLVELMGGEINLQSEPGHGSTFTVKLPIRTPSESGTKSLAPRKEASQ
jgi:PAS domain S-box-containing protein